MRVWPLAFVLSLTAAGLGQSAPTGKAQTAAPCSPAVSGHHNTFNIQCKVDLKEGKEVLEILNKILANQMDFDRVNEKLNEILQNINPNLPTKTYFCNGQWRTAGPSATAGMAISMGGDSSELQREIMLYKQRDFQALLTACQEQFEQAPEWLTPKLTCGLAYLAVNDKENAKKMMQDYESRKGPAYDVAPCTSIDQFLHQHLDSQ